MTEPTQKTAIQQAVEDVGGQTSLAKKIGVSQGLVWQWCNGASIPTHHFAAITSATSVTAEQLLADEMAKSAARAALARKSGKQVA